MTAIVEKMARAISRAHFERLKRLGHPTAQTEGDTADGYSERCWGLWTDHAKAALEALREPSEGMVEAGDAISVRDFVPAGQFTTLTWQAMLTAALGQQP